MVIGLDRSTFAPIGESARLWDAAREAVRTVRGSRVLRRNLGSNLADYIDRSNSAGTRAMVIAEATSAITTMVPELSIKRAEVISSGKGMALRITTKQGEVVTL